MLHSCESWVSPPGRLRPNRVGGVDPGRGIPVNSGADPAGAVHI